MTTTIRPHSPRYSFSNDDSAAANRHDHLAAILDEFTQSRLLSAGDLTGKRCLDVGAGGGSVARWMVDRVGPTGRVAATDLNPVALSPGQGYEIIAHNLVTEPVPDGPWDIIHARLVLLHIPERVQILRKLAGALAPGGALVIEEWASEYLPKLTLSAPDAASGALIEAYHTTLIQRILTSNGNDPTWAGRVHATMVAEGLVDVDTAIESRSWRGGEPGALLIIANIEQVYDRFQAEGFTAEDLDRLCELARDPRVVIRSHFTYSTIGRKSRLVS